MKIRIPIAVVTLGVVILLSACATYPARDEYASRLRDTPVLAGDISDQQFNPIETGEWVKYELGGDANVLDLGKGKTFFAAFAIGPDPAPRRLELRSRFSSVSQARGHVVLPTVRVLDANFKTLLEEESDMRQSSAPDGATEFAHQFELPADARYVVVHTDPESVKREVPWHFSLYLSAPITAGSESRERAKVGLGGPMRIRVDSDSD